MLLLATKAVIVLTKDEDDNFRKIGVSLGVLDEEREFSTIVSRYSI